MLKKRQRLRSHEVDEVLAAGQSARSAHLQLKFVVKQGFFRSAAVVPKSLARKATARNSLRRSLYRALGATATPPLGGNAVFFVRLVPKEKPAATFANEIPALFASLLTKLK